MSPRRGDAPRLQAFRPQGTAEPWCYAARALERVLVLNASYEPLDVCSLRRAHVLVWKGRDGDPRESHERPLRSASTNFARPHVIRLVTYVRVPRVSHPANLAAGSLRARRLAMRLLRHGIASGSRWITSSRARGGASVWENVVASCAPCNHRKGDRLLEETSMSLRTTPRPPTPVLFIRLTTEDDPRRVAPVPPGDRGSRGRLAELARTIGIRSGTSRSRESPGVRRSRAGTFRSAPSATSRARPPPAPRARARPTSGRGRAP